MLVETNKKKNPENLKMLLEISIVFIILYWTDTTRDQIE